MTVNATAAAYVASAAPRPLRCTPVARAMTASLCRVPSPGGSSSDAPMVLRSGDFGRFFCHVPRSMSPVGLVCLFRHVDDRSAPYRGRVPTPSAPDEPAAGGAAGATALEEGEPTGERAAARGARAELPAATLRRFHDKDPDALGEVYD